MIENLLEEAEESPDDSLNAAIEMLSRATEAYENQDDELTAFEKLVTDRPEYTRAIQSRLHVTEALTGLFIGRGYMS